jgi:glycosyltransferase involved in cell wall biosynthesis
MTPRAAIVQDWFFAPGGSEQVALELATLVTDSPVYTTFADRESAATLGPRLRPWPLQRLLGPTRSYRSLLPLYPFWFENLDLREYDLVVSSSSAFAKAVRTRPGAQHVAYVHTPMRYAWDLDSYLQGAALQLPARLAARALKPWLRRWDRRTSRRPTVLIANSEVVRERIRRDWGLDAEVIHPPVHMADIGLSRRDDGFLLVVARLLAYRRIDLVVEAATRMRRDLVVIGSGPESHNLKVRAGPTVSFIGNAERSTVVDHLQRCHAYVAPGEEDFGIAVVEAMAAGKPVIAYRAGGALETVVDRVTGLYFREPSVDALAEAIDGIDDLTFDAEAIRTNAERFEPAVFRRKFVEVFSRLGVDPSLYRDALL